MEIREGYKKTDVGVIPQEWECIQLGTTSRYEGGSQPPLSTFSNVKKKDYIRLIQIRDYKTDKYATYIPVSLAKRFCNEDEIMIGRYGPPIFQILKGIKGAYNVALMKALPLDIITNSYLYYTLKRDDLFRYIELLSQRSSGQTGVDLVGLKAYLIALPPLPEQQAIATALSDIDGLIASLKKLINKKKNIKQGAMQELLTGKKRLDGFSGEWVEIPLGSITKINTGKKNNEDKVHNGKYPFFVRSKQIEKIDSYSFDGEAIIVPGEGNIGEIFHYINGKFDFHQRVYKISDFSKEIHAKYIYFYIAKYFGEYALKNTVKATVDSLRLPTFQEFIVKLSPTLEEQTAIAKVLSDIDNEIEALEQKLSKYKDIKQGMMQELLTGRIRLVETDIQSHIINKEAIIDKPKSNGHTKEFDEAVVISAIVSRFASEQFPMGAFKRQKFAYLLHRYHENIAEGYGKFAAGPYNSHTKYGGAEKIAQNNKYVKEYTRDKIKGFVKAEKCKQAIDYFNEWYGREVLEWLDQFKFVKKEELELLATVDMAMVDLRQENKMVNVPGVKSIIQNSSEWKAKLNRDIFSDDNIKLAIEWSNRIFEN